MSDTSYLQWPFFDSSHAELASALDAWACTHIAHSHGSDVDAECRALATAVRLHVERRVFLNDSQTVIFG